MSELIMPQKQEGVDRETLCTAVRAALAIADRQGATLIGALLDQVLDAARCADASAAP
jgi:hypothetical protein